MKLIMVILQILLLAALFLIGESISQWFDLPGARVVSSDFSYCFSYCTLK